MSESAVSPAVRATVRVALVAALLLAGAARAAGADASLELFYGPDESGWLTLRAFQATLDGQPLQVGLPARGADPAVAFATAPLAAGTHRLEIETGQEGDSSVFSYVDVLTFRMRGVLQLDVRPGDVVAVRARVLDQPGMTVKWEDRFRLALDAQVRRTAVPEVAAAPEGTPAAQPGPAAGATPAAPAMAATTPAAAAAPRAAARPGPMPCTLEPIRFAFDQATLPAPGEVALDRFALCLAGNTRAVRLEGHTDSLGPDAHNEWLGAQRAAAAARFLREHGVAPERITVRSLSAGQPTCTGDDAACRARNRRVEAVVLE